MTSEEAINIISQMIKDEEGFLSDNTVESHKIALKALEREPILDKIRAEIAMYEADCRLQGGTDECEKCNSNVFGSIYRIIDKYKAEFEPQESEE